MKINKTAITMLKIGSIMIIIALLTCDKTYQFQLNFKSLIGTIGTVLLMVSIMGIMFWKE